MNHPRVSTKMLRVDKVTRLFDIFNSKKWPDISKSENTEFGDFCDMLSYLTDDEQDLIIELTKDFLWVSTNEYFQLFLCVFKIMVDSLDVSKKRLFILPLIAKDDIGLTKSSSMLYYMLKCETHFLQRISERVSISLIDGYAKLNDIKIQDSDLFCLIDDYIGTGETACDAIECLFEKGISSDNCLILSLVSQESGIEKIKEKNVGVYTGTIRKRVFTDTLESQTLKKIMQNIEDRMGVNSLHRFGYGQSEALVRMSRTPNNTFPIYWMRSKSIPIVPFPR